MNSNGYQDMLGKYKYATGTTQMKSVTIGDSLILNYAEPNKNVVTDSNKKLVTVDKTEVSAGTNIEILKSGESYKVSLVPDLTLSSLSVDSLHLPTLPPNKVLYVDASNNVGTTSVSNTTVTGSDNVIVTNNGLEYQVDTVQDIQTDSGVTFKETTTDLRNPTGTDLNLLLEDGKDLCLFAHLNTNYSSGISFRNGGEKFSHHITRVHAGSGVSALKFRGGTPNDDKTLLETCFKIDTLNEFVVERPIASEFLSDGTEGNLSIDETGHFIKTDNIYVDTINCRNTNGLVIQSQDIDTQLVLKKFNNERSQSIVFANSGGSVTSVIRTIPNAGSGNTTYADLEVLGGFSSNIDSLTSLMVFRGLDQKVSIPRAHIGTILCDGDLEVDFTSFTPTDSFIVAKQTYSLRELGFATKVGNNYQNAIMHKSVSNPDLVFKGGTSQVLVDDLRDLMIINNTTNSVNIPKTSSLILDYAITNQTLMVNASGKVESTNILTGLLSVQTTAIKATNTSDIQIENLDDENGLIIKRLDNTFKNGILWQNTGDSFTNSIYTTNESTPGLVISCGKNEDRENLTEVATFKNNGNMEIHNNLKLSNLTPSTNLILDANRDIQSETLPDYFFFNSGPHASTYTLGDTARCFIRFDNTGTYNSSAMRKFAVTNTLFNSNVMRLNLGSPGNSFMVYVHVVVKNTGSLSDCDFILSIIKDADYVAQCPGYYSNNMTYSISFTIEQMITLGPASILRAQFLTYDLSKSGKDFQVLSYVMKVYPFPF